MIVTMYTIIIMDLPCCWNSSPIPQCIHLLLYYSFLYILIPEFLIDFDQISAPSILDPININPRYSTVASHVESIVQVYIQSALCMGSTYHDRQLYSSFKHLLPIRLNAHVFTYQSFDSHLLGFNSLDLVIINESNITEDLLAHYIDDRLKKFFSKKQKMF